MKYGVRIPTASYAFGLVGLERGRSRIGIEARLGVVFCVSLYIVGIQAHLN